MSLLASQLTAVTRQLGRITLKQTPVVCALPQAAEKTLIARSFASKRLGKKQQTSKKKLKRMGKPALEKQEETAALQHQEWVKFQQSIAVDGFDTGATLTAKTSTKKSRGGKNLRRKSMEADLEEKIAERKRMTDVGGGLFPPMRFSDEETERLLAQAYAALPERAGKRGTRNLKRQKKRWFLVRKIRKKYKRHMAAFQVRKMEKRSHKVRDVKQVLNEAPSVLERDRAYQAEVFRRWAANMVQGQEEQLLEEGQSGHIEKEEQ